MPSPPPCRQTAEVPEAPGRPILERANDQQRRSKFAGQAVRPKGPMQRNARVERFEDRGGSSVNAVRAELRTRKATDKAASSGVGRCEGGDETHSVEHGRGPGRITTRSFDRCRATRMDSVINSVVEGRRHVVERRPTPSVQVRVQPVTSKPFDVPLQAPVVTSHGPASRHSVMARASADTSAQPRLVKSTTCARSTPFTIVRRLRPGVVLGMGGFVSGPGGVVPDRHYPPTASRRRSRSG